MRAPALLLVPTTIPPPPMERHLPPLPCPSSTHPMDSPFTVPTAAPHPPRFLLAELGTSGSLDGQQRLIVKGRFLPKSFETVLRRYVNE